MLHSTVFMSLWQKNNLVAATFLLWSEIHGQFLLKNWQIKSDDKDFKIAIQWKQYCTEVIEIFTSD